MAFSAGVDGSHTCDWPLCDARLLSYGLHQHQEDGRLLHLLLTLRTQLAPPRRNDVGLAEACRSDVAQLCAEEPEGAVLGCLHRNRKKLSKACRAEEVRMDVMQARAAAAAGRSALQAENRVCIWLVLRLKFNNFCFGCTPQATTDKLELFLAANSCVQSESIDLRPSVAAACREELTGHCPHMPPGSGHSLNCLLAMVVVHGHDFSPVCLEVLDTLQEHRMFDLRTGGWAMPARRQGRGCACLSTESRVAVAGNAALGGGSSAGRLPGLQHSTAQHSTAQHSTALQGCSGYSHMFPLPGLLPPADYQLRRACKSDIGSTCAEANATSDQLDGAVLRCLVGSVGKLTGACASEVSRAVMMGLNFYKQVSCCALPASPRNRQLACVMHGLPCAAVVAPVRKSFC